MSKSKTTKRALLTSVVAIFMCVTMLIGTTFAWFTDTASSGVNKIQAGNLDVEVKYSKNGTTWDNLEGTDSLFSGNLWEPGHTEVVYLKITNAGTLALNYKVLVNPVSENGGVNVNGESFKLSDYLVFGTTAPLKEADFAAFDNRADARNAVSANGMGLNVNSLTKTGTMAGKTDDATDVQYLALVVYMPETVGNEANYKKGTAAPTIELGIKVIATQKTAESDSFGNDYDEGAVNDAFYTVGSYYNYFPQVSASAPVVAGGDTVITATGKLNQSDTTVTTLAKVTVPAAALADGVTKVDVSVKPTDATNSNAQNTIATEINNGREVSNFDVKVSGIKDGNTADIPVEIFVGKGLSNVKVFHNGTEITGARYDAATGIVSFTTTSFSDYTVSYAPAVAAIGETVCGSLESAVAAANNGDTVKLLKDVTLEAPLEIKKSVTLDGVNGRSVKIGNGKSARVININDNTENIDLTLKNLNVVGPTSGIYTRGVSAYNNTGKITLTLDNCSVSANYYALNIAGANANVEVIIKNSTAVAGWCAFQTWSAGTKATFENCTLIGNNDKGYNADGWNDFATIVINEDTTNVDLTFKNCRIEANQTTGNNQYFLSIRAARAKIVISDCSFFVNGNKLEGVALTKNISVYNPEAIDFNMTIDGVQIQTDNVTLG